MSLKVNTNILSVDAQRNLAITRLDLSKTMEKLSSGLRINKAADDAAGLAISEKMRTQIRGYSQALSNAQDGINLIQTTEGALNETETILHRMRELAIQASNDTLVTSDRQKIQEEVSQLRTELTQIAWRTEFNSRKLLDGSVDDTKIGAEATADVKQNMRVGQENITIPMFSDLLSNVSATTVTGAGSAGPRTAATVDAAFQFKIVAWQMNGSSPVSVAVEVRSSLDGLVTTIRLGVGLTANPGGTNGIYTLTVGTNGVNMSIGQVNVSFANISVSDIGKTALIQVIARKEAVTVDKSLTLHVGPNEGQFVKVGMEDMTANSLRLERITFVGTTDEDCRMLAQSSIGVLDDALERVNSFRARLGAVQNRLESNIRNMNVTKENLQNSESSIRDTDFAKETANLTRAQIMVQAGTAILSQANADPQSALTLLK